VQQFVSYRVNKEKLSDDAEDDTVTGTMDSNNEQLLLLLLIKLLLLLLVFSDNGTLFSSQNKNIFQSTSAQKIQYSGLVCLVLSP